MRTRLLAAIPDPIDTVDSMVIHASVRCSRRNACRMSERRSGALAILLASDVPRMGDGAGGSITSGLPSVTSRNKVSSSQNVLLALLIFLSIDVPLGIVLVEQVEGPPPRME